MKKLSKIDTAIVILILTAVSYGIAYAYQRGYKSYYGLPSMFIELNIDTITPIVCAVYLIFILLFMLFYVAWEKRLVLLKLLKIKPRSLPNPKNSLELVIAILALFVPLSFYLYTFGQYGAELETDYMIIRQEERLFVAVTSYKDSIIIAPLDLEKESITPKFKVMEMKEIKDTEMIRFENGLKVEDVRNSKDLIE